MLTMTLKDSIVKNFDEILIYTILVIFSAFLLIIGPLNDLLADETILNIKDYNLQGEKYINFIKA